ncbi:MAG TPA: PRC-barrel domain-containing protein [Noviherbaspirillum sp.]
MLRSAKDLFGFAIRATDGDIGSVADLYFDDVEWAVRYLAVDTGGWLPGRKVLISLRAVSQLDWNDEAAHVAMRRQQVKDSPSIDADEGISRQYETALHDYYGYPYYWIGPHLWGDSATPAVDPRRLTEDEGGSFAKEERDAERQRSGSILRSAGDMVGFEVRDEHNEVAGHIRDLLYDDDSWSVRFLDLDTAHWLPGRDLLVPVESIRHIDWHAEKATTGITRSQIEDSEEYDRVIAAYSPYLLETYRNFSGPRRW